MRGMEYYLTKRKYFKLTYSSPCDFSPKAFNLHAFMENIFFIFVFTHFSGDAKNSQSFCLLRDGELKNKNKYLCSMISQGNLALKWHLNCPISRQGGWAPWAFLSMMTSDIGKVHL